MEKQTPNKNKMRRFEPLFVSTFWVLLFVLPVVFNYKNGGINWNYILNVWVDYLPLLILFCINRFVLIPGLLYKSKNILYVICVLGLISFIVLSSTTLRRSFANDKKLKVDEKGLLRMPRSKAFVPQALVTSPSAKRHRSGPYPPYVNLILLSILLVGFDTGMMLSGKWSKNEQEKLKLKKESVENQLAFLRNQISPHFLMNTLNNIHSLIDFDSQEAKSAVVKLSTLMRHLLYESDNKPTLIEKEIQFIQSYIELMQLRFTEDVQIQLRLPETVPNKTIPPLLFTSVLENAFKHGISYAAKSFVHIYFSIKDNEIEFRIVNSKHNLPKEQGTSGIGLENTRKRLELLFKDQYRLDINDGEQEFSLKMNIPI